MRHLAYLAFMASVVLGIGCNLPAGPSAGSSSGVGNTGGSNSTQGTMSATIGNFPWTANGRVTATYSRSQNGVGASILNLAGQDFPLTNTLQFSVGSVNAGDRLVSGHFSGGHGGHQCQPHGQHREHVPSSRTRGNRDRHHQLVFSRRENRDRDIQFRRGAERRHHDEGGYGRNVQRDVLSTFTSADKS